MSNKRSYQQQSSSPPPSLIQIPPAQTRPAKTAPNTEFRCWVTLIDYPSTLQPTGVDSVSRTIGGARRAVAILKQNPRTTNMQITDGVGGLGYEVYEKGVVVVRVRVVETVLHQ